MRLRRLRTWLLAGPRRMGPAPAWPESRIVRALGLGVTLLLALAAGALVLREHQQTQSTRLEQQRVLARVMSDQATRTVDAASLLLATLARHLAEHGPGAVALQQPALAALLLQYPDVRSIALLARDGRVLGGTDADVTGLALSAEAFGPWPDAGGERLGRWTAGRGLPDLALAARSPASHPSIGFLPLVRRVAHRADDYLLVALLHPDQLATVMRSMLGDTAAEATLAGFDGHVIATTSTQPLGGQDLSTHAVFSQRLRERDQLAFAGPGLLADDALVALRASPSRPLVVVVEQDRRSAAAAHGWRAVGGPIAWAAVASTALMGMTWIAGRGLRARERARRRLDHAQLATRRREQELSMLFGGLLHGVFRCTPDGTLTFANARWAQLAAPANPAAQASAPRRLDQWVHEADGPALQALLRNPKPGEARQAVLRLRAPCERRFDFSVMPHFVGGALAGFFGSAVEVTERDLALSRLAEELAFGANLIELNPLPTSLLDEQGCYLAVNRAWQQLTGHVREQVLGRPAGQLLDPQEALLHDQVDDRLRADGQPVRYAVQYTRADGSRRDLLVHKVLVPGRAGAAPVIMASVLDVTDLRDAERALAEARDRAEDASRVKSEFIANVSHELRTPLQSIIGFAELGLAAEPGAQHRALYDDILASGQRMLALVNDLLDVARIDSVVGPIHLERCDLRPLAREVVAELRTQAQARSLRVELQLPATALIVKADPLRLQQVLRNLLANAIRFSPIGGVVVIDGGPTESGGVSVRVADRGPGIPPADLDRIFEAFAQASGAPSGEGGTGLGLAISRKIALAHGGALYAENLAEGGCRFHLHLPARTPGETRPAPLGE